MKYKIVLQPDETNCGVACLSMICAYYGIKKYVTFNYKKFCTNR